MNLDHTSETHAQRVLRLRKEYTPRRLRYQKSPLHTLVDKLLLVDSGQDNNLSTTELDMLDKELEPVRRLAYRFRHKKYVGGKSPNMHR